MCLISVHFCSNFFSVFFELFFKLFCNRYFKLFCSSIRHVERRSPCWNGPLSLCLLAISGAAFEYYLTFSVVMLLLLFNNTFFACFNSRSVKRWFTKKGGGLKPDKTAKEGGDPFKVSGREILANMDKNTKQAFRKATKRSYANLSHSIGYLSNIKNTLIILGDTGFREGIKKYYYRICSEWGGSDYGS
jgi:hypothetical protein